MIRTIKFFAPAILLFSGVASAQYTDEINTNRPGQSMSAFAVGQTVFQIESGINAVHDKHSILNTESTGAAADLTIRYGVFMEQLEVIVDMQYRFDQYHDAIYSYSRNDFSRFTIGAKYLIYDPDKNYKPKLNLYSWKANHKFKWHSLIPAVAVYAGANVIGKNNPYTFPTDKLSGKVMAITHNHFGKWVWINNFIYDKAGTDYPSTGWITTLTRGFNAKWSGFLEFQAYQSDYYGDGIIRGGAAYLLGTNVQLDASVSTNFKDTPSILYGGVGFSWRFDADYRDIKLPGEGDREDLLKEDQKKQKKEKEDRKKERQEMIDNIKQQNGTATPTE